MMKLYAHLSFRISLSFAIFATLCLPWNKMHTAGWRVSCWGLWVIAYWQLACMLFTNLSIYKLQIQNLENLIALFFVHTEDVCIYPHPLVFQLIIVVCCTSRNNLAALIALIRRNIHLSFICQVEGFQEKVPLKEMGANCKKKIQLNHMNRRPA